MCRGRASINDRRRLKLLQMVRFGAQWQEKQQTPSPKHPRARMESKSHGHGTSHPLEHEESAPHILTPHHGWQPNLNVVLLL